MTVVCASANPDKVAEMAAILDGWCELVERPAELGEVVEDGDTLEANARKKAVAVAEATGSAALADDTGLEVDALDGAPGVRSARFAGEHASYAENVAALLGALERAGAERPGERRARFRTVVVLRRADGSEVVAEGTVEGTIAAEERGSGGFGYDSVFVADEADGRTFGELTAEQKHAISHRGRALRALAEALGA